MRRIDLREAVRGLRGFALGLGLGTLLIAVTDRIRRRGEGEGKENLPEIENPGARGRRRS